MSRSLRSTMPHHQLVAHRQRAPDGLQHRALGRLPLTYSDLLSFSAVPS